MILPVLLMTGFIVFVQANASEMPEEDIFYEEAEDNKTDDGEGEEGNPDVSEDEDNSEDDNPDSGEGEEGNPDVSENEDNGEGDNPDRGEDGNHEGEDNPDGDEGEDNEEDDNTDEGEDNGEGEGEYVPLEYEDLVDESERAILHFVMPEEKATIDGAVAFTDIPKTGIEITTQDAVLTKVSVLVSENGEVGEETVLYEDDENQILTYEEGTCVYIERKIHTFDDILKAEKDGLYSVKVTMEYLTVQPVYDEKNQRTLITSKKSETFEKNILLDSNAPELSVDFGDSGFLYYFNHPRNAVIRFKDDNIDEESLKVLINGKEYSELSKGKSKSSGNTEYLINFDEDSTYEGIVSIKDLLGNESSVSINEFCIDTKAPVINVNISDEDRKFTNQKRMAKAEISDAHLIGESEITYEFKEGADRFELMVSDKAGNITEYKSKNYIQDYIAPEGEIDGFESYKSYNKDFGFSISASDKWLDVKKSFVEITGLYNGSSNRYFFDKNKDKKVTFETMEYPDDYYVVEYVLCDNAGNESREKKHFTLNRKGSTFFLDENMEMLMGKSLREISGVSMSEWNLNKIIPEKGKVIFAVNAAVKDMTQGVDYIIEENMGSVGYSYNYRFNDSLFKEEGVYTISVRSVDEAGNDNDSHLSKDDVRIVFAIEKPKPEPEIPEEAETIKVKALTDTEIAEAAVTEPKDQTGYEEKEAKIAEAYKDNADEKITGKESDDKTDEDIIAVENGNEDESPEILVKVMFIIIAFLTATGTVIVLFLIVRK
ncbi:MAG: hypothetical protein K5776_02605 [Lachnospiraceae bacterium]|nr:hypothetical protein [Lachnospiraceae bacterium]